MPPKKSLKGQIGTDSKLHSRGKSSAMQQSHTSNNFFVGVNTQSDHKFDINTTVDNSLMA
jgi:hypothetical protein